MEEKQLTLLLKFITKLDGLFFYFNGALIATIILMNNAQALANSNQQIRNKYLCYSRSRWEEKSFGKTER